MPTPADAAGGGWLALLAGWALTYAVHSTLLLGAAWLLVRLRAVRGPAAEEVLWKAAVLGAVMTASVHTAGVQTLGGRLDVPGLGPAEPRVFETSVVRRGGTPVRRRWEEPAPGHAEAVRLGAVFLLLAWGGIASVRLGRIARAHWRVRTTLAGRRPLSDAEAASALAALLAEAGVRRPVRVTACDALPGPAALGAGEVCLPPRALRELSPAGLRAILAHEAAHLVRRDPLWRLLLAGVEAVLPFQPLNALAARRCREAAECLCDDWAVRATGGPRELARSIVHVAGWLTAAPPGPLPAMVDGGSPFLVRLHRLAVRPPDVVGGSRLKAAGLAVLLLALVAAAAPAVGAPSAEARRPVAAFDEVLLLRDANGRVTGVRRIAGAGRPLPPLRVRPR